MIKRAFLGSIAVWLFVGAHAQPSAQVAPPATPTRPQVIAAAKEIMQAARYCTLVTIGPGGQPQARIVDPFPPEEDLTIWIATNPLTRKVADLRRDPRVTLLYFLPGSSEYVTVVGTATPDTDPRRKAEYWKPEWAGLYKNQNRGDDYQLLRVKPSRLEVVSVRRGISNDPTTWLPVIIDVPQAPSPKP